MVVSLVVSAPILNMSAVFCRNDELLRGVEEQGDGKHYAETGTS